MSSVFVWFCVEVGGVSGAGAAASHLTALDPISLALLAPQVTAASHHHRPPRFLMPIFLHSLYAQPSIPARFNISGNEPKSSSQNIRSLNTLGGRWVA